MVTVLTGDREPFRSRPRHSDHVPRAAQGSFLYASTLSFLQIVMRKTQVKCLCTLRLDDRDANGPQFGRQLGDTCASWGQRHGINFTPTATGKANLVFFSPKQPASNEAQQRKGYGSLHRLRPLRVESIRRALMHPRRACRLCLCIIVRASSPVIVSYQTPVSFRICIPTLFLGMIEFLPLIP